MFVERQVTSIETKLVFLGSLVFLIKLRKSVVSLRYDAFSVLLAEWSGVRAI